jgi:hypothetical protein
MLGGVVVVAALVADVVWWTVVVAGFVAVVAGFGVVVWAEAGMVSAAVVSAARRVIEGNFEIIVIPV